MSRRIVLDIESAKTTDDVGGWKNKHKMGIAVLCAVDFDTGEKLVFSDDEFETIDGFPDKRPLIDIYDFIDGNIIMGYNIKSFDMRLIQEQILKDGRDIRLKLGIFDASVKRLALGNLTKAMFDDKKLMKGADAPIEWKKGGVARIKVLKYCMDDVMKTISVINHGVASGFVQYFDKDEIKQQCQVDWQDKLNNIQITDLTPDCIGGYREEKKGWQCARCPFKRRCIEASRNT